MAGGALALDDGRTEIEIDDVWVASDARADRLACGFVELGIDEAAIRAAIARRGSADPPEASATA